MKIRPSKQYHQLCDIGFEGAEYRIFEYADSLDIFQIIMGIEEEFDIEIDNDEAEKISTVQDAVDQIKKVVE